MHAAAGGVGLWFCQLLRVLGARTIGTAGTEEKCALARENGAEFCINYREETGKKLVRKVMDITEGKGVHVVYDSVGKDMFELDLEVARRGGMVVSYGNAVSCSWVVQKVGDGGMFAEKSSVRGSTTLLHRSAESQVPKGL